MLQDPAQKKRIKNVVVMTMIMHNERDRDILKRLTNLRDPLDG